jgi:hypothetical protein
MFMRSARVHPRRILSQSNRSSPRLLGPRAATMLQPCADCYARELLAQLLLGFSLLNFTYSIPLVIFEYTKQSDYRERDYQ